MLENIFSNEYLFLFGKIIFGGFFLVNGIRHLIDSPNLSNYVKSKNIPMPSFMVAISGLFLILGGIGIIIWKYVPYAISLLIIFLLLVNFSIHTFWKSKQKEKMSEQMTFMYNFSLIGSLLVTAYLYLN